MKSLYVWGSYAKNIENPEFRVRDIDILARTQFHSGDLLSIDENIIKASYDNEYLEDQGYDPIAVKFSQKFLALSKHNIDCWAISSDRKLLHWGPIPVSKDESSMFNKDAEQYADANSGITRKRVNKSSEKERKNWFNHYMKYTTNYFTGMPTGWYKTEDIKVRDITSDAIKI